MEYQKIRLADGSLGLRLGGFTFHKPKYAPGDMLLWNCVGRWRYAGQRSCFARLLTTQALSFVAVDGECHRCFDINGYRHQASVSPCPPRLAARPARIPLPNGGPQFPISTGLAYLRSLFLDCPF